MGLLMDVAGNVVASASSMVKGLLTPPGKGEPRGTLGRVSGNTWMLAGMGTPGLDKVLRVDRRPLQRMADYEWMDDYPELYQALNIYADDSTQSDPRRDGNIVHVSTPSDTYNQIARDCLERIGFEDGKLREIVRSACKMGADYEEIVLKDGVGVVGIHNLPAPMTTPVEDDYGDLKGFLYGLDVHAMMQGLDEYSARMAQVAYLDKTMAKQETDGDMRHVGFDWWQVAMWRHRDKNRHSLLGTSVLDGVRAIWKRLMLVEDAAVLHKLTRAPARDVLYVETGGMGDNEKMAHLQKVKQQHKRRAFTDQTTGEIDMRYSPMNIETDYYIPSVNGQPEVEIDMLQPRDWQNMDLEEYFQQKLFAGIGVPKAMMSYERDMPSRATLSQQDIRFAKTVLRIQVMAVGGIKQILGVNFASLGFKPENVSMKVSLTIPSAIFEMVQMEVEEMRGRVAQSIGDYVDDYWIQKHLLQLSDDEIEHIWERREEQAVREAKLQAKVSKMGGDDGGRGRYSSVTPQGRERMIMEGLPRRDLGADPKKVIRALDELLREDKKAQLMLAEVKGLVRDTLNVSLGRVA